MLEEKLRKFRVILGSASPRRQQLLAELGLKFQVLTADTDEHAPKHYSGAETALHIARIKAEALKPLLLPHDLLITADTEVWQGNYRFGKPGNVQEAREMLQKLSGNSHLVISGVCLSQGKMEHCFTTTTEVYMKKLRPEEIEYYLSTGKPMDKAGAYGIQEWIGLVGIERINGSYTNVVGMPMSEFYSELENFIDQIK